MISPNDLFRFIFKNMMEKKGRVFLTISGILIGIFTFTFFIFASQGLSNAITEQFSSFGINVLVVQSADNGGGGPPSGEGLTDTDIAKIEQVTRGYKYVAPFIFTSPQYEYGRQKEVVVSLAYPEEYWDEIGIDLGLEIEEGRMIREGDKKSIVLGAKTAREEFGDDNEIKVGASLKINDTSFRVIGIIKERGDLFVDNSILMVFDDIQEIAGQDTYTGIRISFFENVDISEMKENIERKLNPNNEEKAVEISSPEQAIEQFNQIIGVLQMIISFVSAVALVVGGINVMNTMYSNIAERVNEISVMKALGATNQDIRSLFLVESSILGLVGAFIGFMLSYGLAEFLSYVITNFGGYNVPVNFSVEFFAGVMIITALFAMLFGTYPAIRAAQVDPADNLRDE